MGYPRYCGEELAAADPVTLSRERELSFLLVGLAWKIAGLATANYLRRFTATVCVALAVATGAASWVVLFWIWQ